MRIADQPAFRIICTGAGRRARAFSGGRAACLSMVGGADLAIIRKADSAP